MLEHATQTGRPLNALRLIFAGKQLRRETAAAQLQHSEGQHQQRSVHEMNIMECAMRMVLSGESVKSRDGAAEPLATVQLSKLVCRLRNLTRKKGSIVETSFHR